MRRDSVWLVISYAWLATLVAGAVYVVFYA
jgi:hypothetical protein